MNNQPRRMLQQEGSSVQFSAFEVSAASHHVACMRRSRSENSKCRALQVVFGRTHVMHPDNRSKSAVVPLDDFVAPGVNTMHDSMRQKLIDAPYEAELDLQDITVGIAFGVQYGQLDSACGKQS
jgi:hypothetical protein